MAIQFTPNEFKFSGPVGAWISGQESGQVNAANELANLFESHRIQQQGLENLFSQMKMDRFSKETPGFLEELALKNKQAQLNIGKSEAEQPYWASNAKAESDIKLSEAEVIDLKKKYEQGIWKFKEMLASGRVKPGTREFNTIQETLRLMNSTLQDNVIAKEATLGAAAMRESGETSRLNMMEQKAKLEGVKQALASQYKALEREATGIADSMAELKAMNAPANSPEAIAISSKRAGNARRLQILNDANVRAMAAKSGEEAAQIINEALIKIQQPDQATGNRTASGVIGERTVKRDAKGNLILE